MSRHPELVKPKDIIYGLYDRPPILMLIFLGIQQMFVCLPYLVLVSVIAKAAHLPAISAANLISLTLIAMGIGTLLQVLRFGPLGSGYLAVVCPMPNYLQPSLLAVQAGGIPLLAGMVVFSGLCQTGIAWLIKKLRFLFPSVLTGVVFCLIGIDMAHVGLKQMLQMSDSIYSVAYIKNIICFAVTLGLMISFNIWGKGLFRLLCSSLGLIIGSLFAFVMGLFGAQQLAALHQASWLLIPHFQVIHYQFSSSLILVFLISSVASALRAMGAIATAQEINDANWRYADQKNLKHGLFADGLAALLGGVIGTTGIGCTPSSVGVSKSSGATSRWIAYVSVVLSFILAFCPKIGTLIFSLPNSVIAAALLFVSSILFTGGIRIVSAQEIDARKTFIICLSLFAGLSTQFFAGFYQQFPSFLQPIVSSILSFGTVVAFILNLIFRIKITKTENMVFNQTDESFSDELIKKISQLGIKKNVAESILKSFARMTELIIKGRHNRTPVSGKFSYNELDLVIHLEYEGNLPPLPERKIFAADDFEEENAFIEGISTLYKDFTPSKTECTCKNGMVSINLHFSM